jgi:hypothetical protein
LILKIFCISGILISFAFQNADSQPVNSDNGKSEIKNNKFQWGLNFQPSYISKLGIKTDHGPLQLQTRHSVGFALAYNFHMYIFEKEFLTSGLEIGLTGFIQKVRTDDSQNNSLSFSNSIQQSDLSLDPFYIALPVGIAKKFSLKKITL